MAAGMDTLLCTLEKYTYPVVSEWDVMDGCPLRSSGLCLIQRHSFFPDFLQGRSLHGGKWGVEVPDCYGITVRVSRTVCFMHLGATTVGA